MFYRMDVLFLAVFFGVSGEILWLSRSFPDTGERFGPAFLPRVLVVMLVGLSLTLGVRWFRAARDGRLVRVRLAAGFAPKALIVLLATAGYLKLLGMSTPLGFPGASILYLFGIGLVFGGRPPARVLLMAVVTSLGLYLFFRTWLHVPLPRWSWF